MKKNFKLFASLSVLAFVGITYIALTGDRAPSQANNGSSRDLALDGPSKSAEKAAPANSSGKVYLIESVSKAVTGKAVDFKYKDGTKTKSFADLTKGKVVFLNFWGTWCPPCRREIPDIIQLSNELKAKDFMVIGMALERDASTAQTKVTDYSTNNGIPYVNFVSVKEIQEAYGGIPAVPTTFIIDKNGNIVEKLVGMKDKATFLASIGKVLK